MHISLCLVVVRCLFCIGECVYLLGLLVSWCELVGWLVSRSVGRSAGWLVVGQLVSLHVSVRNERRDDKAQKRCHNLCWLVCSQFSID